MLSLEGLRVRYPGSDRATLEGLDLTLGVGERLALVGPSGCGKSTVARAVLQLLPPGSLCEGGLLLAGIDPRGLPPPALRRLRGEAVGLVFQDPMTRLNPLLTIGDQITDALAGLNAGTKAVVIGTRSIQEMMQSLPVEQRIQISLIDQITVVPSIEAAAAFIVAA